MILLRALGGCVAAVLLWSAVGNRAIARVARSLTRAERLGWGLAAGLAIQAAVYGAFLLVSANPGPKKMGAAAGLLLVLLTAASRGKPARAVRGVRPDVAAVVLLLFAFAGAAIFLLLAISEPMWGTDFLAVWGFKAKTIFWTGAVPERLFHDPATVWSHPEYPILLPLIFASTSASTGGWNDHALAILYPIFEAGLLVSLYGFLRRRGNATGAAAACLAVAWFFPLFHPYHVGMAEIPLAFSLVLFSEAVLDFAAGDKPGVYARTILASFLCCGLKPEGSLFVVLAGAALAVVSVGRRRPVGRMILCAISPAVAVAGALRLFRGAVSGRDSDWALLGVSRWGELLHRIGLTADSILAAEILPRALPLALLVAIFLLTPRQGSDFLLPPLAAQVACYAAVCAFSTVGPVWQVKTAFARVVAALFPVCALALGARFCALFSGPGEAREIG